MFSKMPVSKETHEAINRLKNWFSIHSSIIIAFSGGMDSSLLALSAHHFLGPRQYQAVMVISEFTSRQEELAAEHLAKTAGLSFKKLEVNLLADEKVRCNDKLRCYHCKHMIFNRIIQEFNSGAGICEGSVTDDDNDYRPGRQAIKELGIYSPLHECGFSKVMVAEALKACGMTELIRPPQSCLASRIATGTPITLKALKQIEMGEALLHDMGMAQCRLRHHGDIARIEVEQDQLHRAVDLLMSAQNRIKSLGFKHICIDIAGYVKGSMN